MVAKIARRVSGRMLLAACSVAVLGASAAYADHAWSTYHWQRPGSQLTVPVGDNVTSVWDKYVTDAVYGGTYGNGWNASKYIESQVVAGSTSPKNCRGVAGTIQVCNSAYGQTGWLGIASISLSGGHITQGTTKLNDTYFNTARYNTPSWRALVTCQEIGHDYGLGHQDEDFNTDLTRSCMDYTNLPGGNETPDAHDFAQLEAIYGHNHTSSAQLASATSAAGTAAADEVDHADPKTWGKPTKFHKNGQPFVFEREHGGGKKTITHVFWIPERVKHSHHDH